MNDEKDVSTEQSAPQADPRLSGADALEGWTQRVECASTQGAEASCRLTRRLPRERRLRRRPEFQRIYRDGERVASRNFVIFGLRCAGAGPGRLGLTASRKVGSAVVRSRCRRRLRELYRLLDDQFIAASVDVVVNARRGCADAPWSELRREFSRCMATLRSRLESRSVPSACTSATSPPSFRPHVDTSQPAPSTPRRPSRDTASSEGSGSD
jgi:ribonuclease P protein component